MLSLRNVARKGFSHRLSGNHIVKPQTFVSLGARYLSTTPEDTQIKTQIPNENRPQTVRDGSVSDRPIISPPRTARTPSISYKISSVADQVNKALTESGPNDAILALTEGLEYLRSMNTANLQEGKIIGLLRKTAQSILDESRAKRDASVDGYASDVEILDKFLSLNIAHASHFQSIVVEALHAEKYNEVLSLWVRYCEESKLNPLMNYPERHREFMINFRGLVYFAYIKLCLKSRKEPTAKFALALLQTNKLASVAGIRSVMLNFKLGAMDNELAAAISKLRMSLADPNDESITTKLLIDAISGNAFATDGALQRIREISKINGKPISEATIGKFMTLYTMSNRAERACELFNGLVENDIVPSVNTWNLLIDAVTVKKFRNMEDKVSTVDTVFQTLLASGVKPDSETYCSLIKAFGSIGDIGKVTALMDDLAKTKDVPISTRVKDNYIIALSNSDVKLAREKLAEYQENGNYTPNIEVFNKLLTAHIAKKEYNRAQEVLTLASESSVGLDVATYTVLIGLLFKKSKESGIQTSSEQLNSLLQEMSANNIKVNNFTLTVIYSGLMSNRNMEAGRRILKYMRDSKITLTKTTYTAAITGEMSFGETERAETLFEEYISAGFLPETPLWNAMIRGFLRNREAERALQYYERSKAGRVKYARTAPNHYTYKFLLNYFLNNRDFQQVEKILADVSEARLPVINDYLQMEINRAGSEGIRIPENIKYVQQ